MKFSFTKNGGLGMQNESKQKVEECYDALEWVVIQFKKVLSGEVAGNVQESLSYAESILKNR